MKTWHKVAGGSTILTAVVLICIVEYVNWHAAVPPNAQVAVDRASHTRMSKQSTSNGRSNSAMNNVVIKVVSSTSVNTNAQRKVMSTVQQMLSSGIPKSMDASGFVQQVYADAGVTVPRTILEQSQTGSMVEGKSQLQAGDMVFFGLNGNNPNTVTFDGIYVGNGMCVCLTTHGLTTISLQDSYWGPRFLYGRQVL